MAHWIIEDHGFGGQIYTCSECRESWNDIYSNVSMDETCPNCGALINEDETEYIENNKRSKSFDRKRRIKRTIYTVFTKDELAEMLDDKLVIADDLDGVQHIYLSKERYEAITDSWGSDAFEEVK